MSGSWLSPPRPRPDAAVRLFCLPHAGGGASVFRSWADLLPPWIGVHAIQLPGRENRLGEPAIQDADVAVEEIARSLRPHLDRPYAFFGHSMGALLAYAVARALCEAGGPHPCHLFAASHCAPHRPDTRAPIHGLPDVEFADRVRRMHGTPEDVFREPELRAIFLPLLRSDFALCESYVHRAGAALPCAVTALGGTEDPLVPQSAIEEWRACTAAAFRAAMLPGGHFILDAARAEILRLVVETL